MGGLTHTSAGPIISFVFVMALKRALWLVSGHDSYFLAGFDDVALGLTADFLVTVFLAGLGVVALLGFLADLGIVFLPDGLVDLLAFLGDLFGFGLLVFSFLAFLAFSAFFVLSWYLIFCNLLLLFCCLLFGVL